MNQDNNALLSINSIICFKDGTQIIQACNPMFGTFYLNLFVDPITNEEKYLVVKKIYFNKKNYCCSPNIIAQIFEDSILFFNFWAVAEYNSEGFLELDNQSVTSFKIEEYMLPPEINEEILEILLY